MGSQIRRLDKIIIMIQETLLTLKLYPTGIVEGDYAKIPDSPGIYMAVSAKSYAKFNKIQKLIYIGRTEDTTPARGLKGRIADHLRQDHAKWRRNCHIAPEERILYFYIPITGKAARLIPKLEAALINYFQPEANIEYKEAIPSNLRLLKTIIIIWPPFLGRQIIDPRILKYKA